MPRYLYFSLLLILLSACAISPAAQTALPAWHYADLRAIDAPEGDTSFSLPDLLAVYTREVTDTVQIRLDFLDLTPNADYTLFLALDTREGGKPVEELVPRYFSLSALFISQAEGANQSRWDNLIVVPFNDLVSVIDASGNLTYDPSLAVERDSELDTLTITFDLRRYLHPTGGFWLQAVLLAGNAASSRVDLLGPVYSVGSPPPPAQAMLVFWNTYPAVNPASALRLWDGAHTGPFNDRHGLRHLLEAAGAANIPITLLDINDLLTFSALESVGGLALLHQQTASDLVYLPVEPYRVVAESWGEKNGSISTILSSSPLPFGYAQFTSSHLTFLPLPGSNLALDQMTAGYPTRLFRWRDARIILLPTGWQRLPEQPEPQGTRRGPALALRKSLAELAYSASVQGKGAPFLLLGGDLNRSAWGDAQAARSTFTYLAAHPWVKFLTPDEFAFAFMSDDIPPNEQEQLESLLQNIEHQKLTSRNYNDSHQSPLKIDNWSLITDHRTRTTEYSILDSLIEDMLASLLAPVPPETPQLVDLRLNYAGQIGLLLATREWLSMPLMQYCSEVDSTGSCWRTIDVDQDTRNEYILASNDFFGVFESQGGSLTTAFVRSPTGLHQVFAPTWQFTVGLADPSTWQPDAGLAADPGQMPGAFFDIPAGGVAPLWLDYQADLSPGSLTFTSPDGQVRKTFTLSSTGLDVHYFTSKSMRILIPLALDAWQRYKPGWSWLYQDESIPNGWVWKVLRGTSPYPPTGEGGELFEADISCQVVITSTASLTPFSFIDSRETIRMPEDPFFDYTRGHLLLFPFAVTEINGEGSFSIHISLCQ